jgi:uncharacterized DUF497 family protein
MIDDDFEWHAAKARKNYRDHGVTFETAKRAFSDPFAIAIIDERENYGEESCNLLGMVEGQLLNVAYAGAGPHPIDLGAACYKKGER